MPKKAVKTKNSKKTPVKKSAKAVKRKLTMLDTLPNNEIEYLECLLFYTERSIPTRGSGKPNEDMVNQAERLKLRIKALKKAV